MMKKKSLNVRSLINQYQTNCDRISEIADVCEKEQRERTDAENAEYETLVRENQLLQMKMQAASADQLRDGGQNVKDANAIIRENMQNGRQTKLLLTRDLVMVSDAEAGGIVPVRVQDILDPLVEGLILDKVGLPLPTGLSGDYVWPTYEAVEASVVGEGVALTDTKINLSKLTATPQRIGIAIPVTRQTIIQSDGIIEDIVRKVIPQSLAILLNKILFSTTKVTNATTLAGPFVDKVDSATSVSATPTFSELNAIKAKVLESGIDGEHLCWIMTKSMKAVLEGEPINSKGIYVPVVQNDMLCGLPIFTTNYISGYIGLGDWRYQPMGLFGDMSFIVDPYSQARKDAVDFVLNVNYGTTTLRPDAFALAKVATA